jgi:hypothetical protein
LSGIISDISGSHFVSVLVLSMAMALIFPISSKYFPHFITIPRELAFPIAEKIATGVERTNAQGQEIISKLIACQNQ